jgi:hypothetical protein
MLYNYFYYADSNKIVGGLTSGVPRNFIRVGGGGFNKFS